MEKLHKNLLFIPIIIVTLLIIALILSFTLALYAPGDPVLGYLPEGPIDWEVYEQVKQALGLNYPLIIQFFGFLFRMLIGDWGRSFSIARMPVRDLIFLKLPRTIDLLLFPLIIGLILGILLGIVSVKSRFKIASRSIQLFSLLGLTIPVFFLGMLFQFFLGYVNPIFPTSGFKTITYDDPPFVTGFRIFDALIAGQYYLIADYINHLILPWISLTIPILVTTILLVRMYLINQKNQPKAPEKRSIVPFAFHIALGFGLIFTHIMRTEITFGLAGFGQLLLDAITNADYWTIVGSFYFVSISFIIVISISLFLYVLYGYVKDQFISQRKMKNKKVIEVK
ncbi:MAG: ABC transporter permease [Promethearchaeota archaeon]|nr:MAG: ABC transporter permease [Candidatus Lokiarchaeota archaeon]